MNNYFLDLLARHFLIVSGERLRVPCDSKLIIEPERDCVDFSRRPYLQLSPGETYTSSLV